MARMARATVRTIKMIAVTIQAVLSSGSTWLLPGDCVVTPGGRGVVVSPGCVTPSPESVVGGQFGGVKSISVISVKGGHCGGVNSAVEEAIKRPPKMDKRTARKCHELNFILKNLQIKLEKKSRGQWTKGN